MTRVAPPIANFLTRQRSYQVSDVSAKWVIVGRWHVCSG